MNLRRITNLITGMGISGVFPHALKIEAPFCFAASDETTALATGTAKITLHMPYAMKLREVFAGLSTAQASGSTFTVDVNKNGTSILSTKITIDNTEETSLTAATPAVLSDTDLAKGDKITIDIDQVGNGTAKGLKLYFIGKYDDYSPVS